MGKTNFLFADFSQHTFTQTHYIVKAEINEAGNDFNIANFIYRTYGEDYIHNDSVDDSLNERSAEDYRFLDDSLLPENDFRNRRRNFSGILQSQPTNNSLFRNNTYQTLTFQVSVLTIRPTSLANTYPISNLNNIALIVKVCAFFIRQDPIMITVALIDDHLIVRSGFARCWGWNLICK